MWPLCQSSFLLFLVECVYHERVLKFAKGFFCIYLNDHVLFSLCSVNVWYITLILYVEPSLHSKNKSYLVMIYNLFNLLLNLLCYYHIEDFCIDIHKECSVIFLS